MLGEQRREGVGADLLLALDEHRDADGQVVAEDPERAEVGGDAGLVVGGAAGVEPAVALGRLERRGVPVGVVVLGLDVVVGVEQHGRRARPGRPCARSPPGRRPRRETMSTLSKPSARNSCRHGLGAALDLAGARRVGADGLDADQVLEVLRTPGQDVRRPGADVARSCRVNLSAAADRVSQSGRYGVRSARSPLARTRPAASASAQASAPVARAIQVSASISTTAGGVPRVCRTPGITCTAAYGGTRTSTERPGARSSSTARKCLVSSRRSAGPPRRGSRAGRGDLGRVGVRSRAAISRPRAGQLGAGLRIENSR